MRAARGLASLRISAGSPESSLLDNAINTNISCDGAFALRERANYKGLTQLNQMDFSPLSIGLVNLSIYWYM